MAWTGNYKQILFTTNTEFTDTWDHLNGPFLISANNTSQDVFIETYVNVKEALTDDEQLAGNRHIMLKLARGFTIGVDE